MGQTCGKCSRLNPTEALYCFFDGQPLPGHGVNGGPVRAGAKSFLHEFVFPSGQVCRSFDELALTCQEHWTAAREVLHKGYLEQFLGGLGRADLARAAQEAARAADPDRGLDDFLGRLPCQVLEPPKLRVEPAEVNLGRLKVGEDRRMSITLVNQGMRLLSGSVLVENAVWLTLGEAPGTQQKVLQISGDMILPVNIRGSKLMASLKPLEARLLFETNGGALTALIRAEVPVQPFAEGVLAGAISPRQIAEKARARAKDAAPLFETGAVAAWYQANGWTYPVQGPAATGLSAVQQFFEVLGLAKPPKVEISDRAVNLIAPPGAQIEHILTVRTPENRPVFATAASDRPWLEVGKIKFKGRNHGSIALVVPCVPNRPGETLLAKVAVTANGNQRFEIPVHLAISGGRATMPAPMHAVEILPEAELVAELVQDEVPVIELVADFSVPGAKPAAKSDLPPAHSELFPKRPPTRPIEVVPEPTTTGAMPKWVHGLPVLLLALVLAAFGVRDFLVAITYSDPGPEEVLLDSYPRIQVMFHDKEMAVTLGPGGVKPEAGFAGGPTTPAVWEPTMRFGLATVKDKDPSGKSKRLTFEEMGATNNTVVRLDGNEWIFGERPFRTRQGPLGKWPGRWLVQNASLDNDPAGRERRGRKSTWIYDEQQVLITQIVEIVPGSQSALLDTCLVHYRIENRDPVQSHRVGLRFLLDTFIGTNDGVPFTIPGARNLCDTVLEFRKAEDMPDFLQALEKADLVNPGTVAHLQIRLGGNLETPDRLTLGAWPNPRLAHIDPRCNQEQTMWEVPLIPIKTLPPGDSCVAIYWNEKELPPGTSRELGFTYGLGSVASGDGNGRLALTVGGSFVPEGDFTLTAYVNRPVQGQKLKLILPDGFRLIEGGIDQDVPPLPSAVITHSPVTWRIRAPDRLGSFVLKVESSTGVSQSQPVIIKGARGIFN